MQRKGPVVVHTAFRPFFLAAAAFASVGVPLLIAALSFDLGFRPALPVFVWHGHEMLFGFAGAVLAGFLLTAAQVWTGQRTVSELGLVALVILWTAGRATAAGLGPSGVAAVVNLAFLPWVAVLLVRPIVRAKRYRNLPFPGLLLCLSACQLAIWGWALGLWPFEWAQRGEWVAIDLLAAVVALISGRIIPMFTRNALDGFKPRGTGLIDGLSVGSFIVVASVHGIGVTGWKLNILLLVAGGLSVARMWGWGGLRAVRKAPFVAILHVGYGLLAAGFIIESIMTGVGRHVITIGGIGFLCLSMMARVTLGHTGRSLQPPACFWPGAALLVAAVPMRAAWSFGNASGPATWLLISSGVAWALAFALFLVAFGRILVTPRVDGAPG